MNQIVSYKHQSNLRRHLVLDLEQSKIGLMDYYSGKWLGKDLLQYCALISHSYEFLLHCFLSWPKFAICWTLLETWHWNESNCDIISLGTGLVGRILIIKYIFYGWLKRISLWRAFNHAGNFFSFAALFIGHKQLKAWGWS